MPLQMKQSEAYTYRNKTNAMLFLSELISQPHLPKTFKNCFWKVKTKYEVGK